MRYNIASIIAWLTLGIIWGSNFIFMKWATDYISAEQVVLARVALGFVPVLIYASIRHQLKLVHLKHSGHFVVMACLAAAIYYYGFARGTSLLPSGIAGAVSGSIPLFSVIAAALFLRDERLSKVMVLGLIVGFIGVLMIARPFETGLNGASTEGVLFMTLGSFSLGISFVYAKKYVMPLKLPTAALATYQLGFATIILAFVIDFGGISNIAQNSQALTGLVLGLGLAGTGLAYIIYYYIVSEMGAVTASSVTYVPPIVALAIGVVIVGEQIEVTDYFAAALILVGVVLLNFDRTTKTTG
jgi:drug/metabolite transporter (DMT)-like permease